VKCKINKVLDLFCCCGGISKGFHDAGFKCTGVDITDDHQYPYEFIKKNVFSLDINWMKKFDLIHASPPCQNYSWSAALHRAKGKEYPDLVARTRNLLIKTGRPFIIENVIGAPVRKDLVLCGTMFNLRLIRHRIFEIHNFTVLQPPHEKHKLPFIDSNGRQKSYYASVAGHGGHGYTYRLDDWKKAMGINWVDDKNHLTQMIPPKYSNYIGKYF